MRHLTSKNPLPRILFSAVDTGIAAFVLKPPLLCQKILDFFLNYETLYKLRKATKFSLFGIIVIIIIHSLDRLVSGAEFTSLTGSKAFDFVPELLGSIAVYWILDTSIKQLFGLSELPHLPLDSFVGHIKFAKRIRILETFTDLVNDTRVFQNFLDSLHTALNNDAEIQVLLIHPDSDGARQRAEELSRAGNSIHNVPQLIQRTIARFYQLQNDEDKLGEHLKKTRLAIRLYDASPSIALHMWDRDAFVSFFPVNQRSDKSPNLKISMVTTFGHYVTSKFEELWNHQTSVPLNLYMMLEVKAIDFEEITTNGNETEFYYIQREKNEDKVLYATRTYNERLFENMVTAETIDVVIAGHRHKAQCHTIDHSEKDDIIAKIMERYDWNGIKEREKHIGEDTRVFIIKLIV